MSEPDLACTRAGLLLSLRADGAATPEQSAELDRHLAACAACRRAERTDAAVRQRLRDRAAGTARPGFAAAVVAAAIRDRAAAVAQNRLLRWTAAAAVFVAAVSVAATAMRDPAAAAPGASASARDAARSAVLAPRALATAPERR